MKKTIKACPRCGSGALWHRPGGSILCTACMALFDKNGKTIEHKREEKQCTKSKSGESGN